MEKCTLSSQKPKNGLDQAFSKHDFFAKKKMDFQTTCYVEAQKTPFESKKSLYSINMGTSFYQQSNVNATNFSS